MSGITTHVLDTASGRPAAGVPVTLELEGADGWTKIGEGVTNPDGRIANLTPTEISLDTGTYRLTFDTGQYFATQNVDAFYPEVTVVFRISDSAQHYHVPLLLSLFGYSTYRGS